MALPTAQEMLAALRDSGMTDLEIAAETGISQPTITRLRNGAHKAALHETWSAISELHLKRQAELAKSNGRRAA